MAGWHHRLNGYEFEWTLEVGDGQGGLACCDSWGHKESDMTEWLICDISQYGLPRWLNGNLEAGNLCQYKRVRRCSFDPWVRKIIWRRKRQPIPVFLPREVHGQRNLPGYSPWDCKESDTTEWLHNARKEENCYKESKVKARNENQGNRNKECLWWAQLKTKKRERRAKGNKQKRQQNRNKHRHASSLLRCGSRWWRTDFCKSFTSVYIGLSCWSIDCK